MSAYPARPQTKRIPTPTEEEIDFFTDHLLRSKAFPPRRYLVGQRRIPNWLLRRHRIGWDPKRDAYTIPMVNEESRVECVKWIKPTWATEDGERRVWVCNDHDLRWPMLFPTYDLSEHDPILVCEGEWDALSLISLGLHAVTSTGGAGKWDSDWNVLFQGKRVFLLPDSDEYGEDHAAFVARQLWDVAAEVRTISWEDLR